jgi:hypothetical protein
VYALDLNKTCTTCHTQDKIAASHAQWLPQSNLHLGSINCITCHTKSDAFVLSVYVSRGIRKQQAQRRQLPTMHILNQRPTPTTSQNWLIEIRIATSPLKN